MIVDLIRQVADWLSDGTTGVNTVRTSVPRDGGDPAPAAVNVYDQTREAWVAMGIVLREKTGAGPMLLVQLHGDVEMPVRTDQIVAGWPRVELAVRYVARNTTRDDLVRDAWQTLRCAQRVLADQFNKTPGTSWSRNGTLFEKPTARLVPFSEPLEGDELVVAVLLLTFEALDPWALDTA